MAPTLYVIRHGETDWNREGRLQGQRDLPLNEVGREQAERNGGALAAARADWGGVDFVSSPLLRARQTMEIARHRMGLDSQSYRTDPRLSELTFGRWEGLTLAELKLRDPVGYRERTRRRWHVVPPDGESYAMLAERVRPVLDALDRDTAMVAHGGVMRVIQVMLLGSDPLEAPYLPTPQDRVMVVEGERLNWL
jgi:broad specificity phosphatase PhoE